MNRRPERWIWFRLAKDLGMSVARAQREINSREFAEWVVFLTERKPKQTGSEMSSAFAQFVKRHNARIEASGKDGRQTHRDPLR